MVYRHQYFLCSLLVLHRPVRAFPPYVSQARDRYPYRHRERRNLPWIRESTLQRRSGEILQCPYMGSYVSNGVHGILRSSGEGITWIATQALRLNHESLLFCHEISRVLGAPHTTSFTCCSQVDITVFSVPDDPEITRPASFTLAEDGVLYIHGVGVHDADVLRESDGDLFFTMWLEATSGTITLDSTSVSAHNVSH